MLLVVVVPSPYRQTKGRLFGSLRASGRCARLLVCLFARASRVEDAMPLRPEDLLVPQLAREQARREVLDLRVRHLARVVLEEGDEARAARVEGEGVHVAEVQHQLL